jgi:hypothetical protein
LEGGEELVFANLMWLDLGSWGIQVVMGRVFPVVSRNVLESISSWDGEKFSSHGHFRSKLLTGRCGEEKKRDAAWRARISQ